MFVASFRSLSDCKQEAGTDRAGRDTPPLPPGLRRIRLLAYAILDGTLIPIDRLARPRPPGSSS
jgi:hypothetical protein